MLGPESDHSRVEGQLSWRDLRKGPTDHGPGLSGDFVGLLVQKPWLSSATYISNFRYLNYIKYGADWRDVILGSVPSNSGYLKKISPNSKYYNFRYYNCDPQNFTGSQEQKDLVYGGIAAMWGEFVDNTNIEARFWYVLWKSNNSLFLYITLGHEVPQ